MEFKTVPVKWGNKSLLQKETLKFQNESMYDLFAELKQNRSHPFCNSKLRKLIRGLNLILHGLCGLLEINIHENLQDL